MFFQSDISSLSIAALLKTVFALFTEFYPVILECRFV